MPTDVPDHPQPAAPSSGDAPPEAPSATRAPSSAQVPAAPSLRGPAAVILLFALALLVCVAAYLALAVPGPWFPGVAAKTWAAQDMTLTRGDGALVGSELVITAPDPTGTVLVTLTPDLRSGDYAGIAWLVTDVPDQADVRLLWRSGYRPEQLNNAPVTVESGSLLPTVLVKDPAWVGRITGLALAVRGTLTKPIRIRAVTAKPMGAADVLGDRVREWLTFEGWSGTSINTITGGADVQDLPLPLLLATALLLAGGAVAAIARWLPRFLPMPAAAACFGLFVAAWLVADARWTWNLVRQVEATAARYAGKSPQSKHLAAVDGTLFAFTVRARATLPEAPARVFVVADEPYLRNRAAYHLYPHNVYAEPRANSMPRAEWLRPGDWLLVYQRRGVQYDAAAGKLRWDGTQTASAELKLFEPGAALFLIR